MVLEQSFNGAGDTQTPTWINFFCFWIVQIPVAWLLATQFGFEERGVFIAVPVAYSVLAVLVMSDAFGAVVRETQPPKR